MLLTLLRMIQGLSVGGEYTTSIVFLVERAPPGRRGLLGAIALSAAPSSASCWARRRAPLLAALMPAEALDAWGWRIPFLLGLLVGFAGLACCAAAFAEMPPTTAASRSPLVETVPPASALLVRLAGLAVFNAVGFYLMFVYVVSWLQFVDGVAPDHALGINTASMVALSRLRSSTGWLSDRVGRAAAAVRRWRRLPGRRLPLFWLMHHDDLALILVGQLGFVDRRHVHWRRGRALIEAAPPGCAAPRWRWATTSPSASSAA